MWSAASAYTEDPGPAVLWVYDQNLNKLYSSGGLTTTVGFAVNLPVPTVFNKRVYMGTKSEIDVFGLCSMAPNGRCLN